MCVSGCVYLYSTGFTHKLPSRPQANMLILVFVIRTYTHADRRRFLHISTQLTQQGARDLAALSLEKQQN